MPLDTFNSLYSKFKHFILDKEISLYTVNEKKNVFSLYIYIFMYIYTKKKFL